MYVSLHSPSFAYGNAIYILFFTCIGSTANLKEMKTRKSVALQEDYAEDIHKLILLSLQSQLNWYEISTQNVTLIAQRNQEPANLC